MRPNADYVLQGREPRLDRRAVGRLRVNPDQRLGAARPKQHPAAVLEIELETVVGADALHANTRDLLRLVLLERVPDPLAVHVVGLAHQVDVVARVRSWSNPPL